MPKIIKTLRANFQTLGWLNGFFYLMSVALSRISGDRARLIKYDLVVQPIHTEPLLPSHRGRRIRVYEATPENTLLHSVPHRNEGVIADRFSKGGRCLVAELNDDLAGFLWFSHGDYLEDEVRCLFRPEPAETSVWDYDVYVADRYRLSPVFMKLWQEANSLLYAEGFRDSLSRISAFNPGSHGSHARLGAKKIGWATFLVVGSMQLMWANRPPFIHLSLKEQHYPVLRLRAR
jgi:hypothetical protein